MSDDLKGRIDLDVAGATHALDKAKRAFRDLGLASTVAGKEMSASQLAASKAIIASYQSLRVAQSKVVNDALSLNRRLKEIELKGVAERKAIRATAGLTNAKAAVVTSTGASVVNKNDTIAGNSTMVAQNQSELLAAKKITEERRQQIMLADAAARRANEGAMRELALRKQIFKEQMVANAATNAGTASLGSMRFALQGVVSTMGIFGGVSLLAAGAVFGVGVAWQKSFADVIRTTGVAGDEIGFLKSQFTDLVQTLPVSWEKLTEIGTLAGQLGIAKSNVSEFVKITAMFSATTDVSVDAAATAFGRLNALIPSVKGNYEGLANSILKVGVNSVATESQIIKITTQLASIAGPVGYSYEQIIGLSGALASVGAPPELSRGTITRTFGLMGRAIADGGIKLEKFGAISGMSGAAFAKGWNEDAAGTFQSFMNGIATSGADADLVLREVGVTSVRDVPLLKRLAGAADSTGKVFDAVSGKGGLMAETMRLAGDAAEELQNQYKIISGTVAAKLQVALQNVLAALDAIGQSKMGDFGTVLDDLTKGIRDFSESVDKNFMLLDTFELPWTNGEVLSSAAVFIAIAGALGLVIAGLGQVAVGGLALAQVFVGIRGHMAATAVSTAALATTTNAAALSYGGMGRAFGAGAGVMGAARNGINRLSSSIVGVGAAIGPQLAIMAAFAAAVAVFSWADDLANAGSSADEAASSFITAKNSLDLLGGIEVNAFDNLARTNLKPFITDMDQLGTGLENIQGSGFFSDFGHKWNDIFRTGDAADATTFDRFSSGITKLDAGFEKMVSAGNGDKAVAQLRAMVRQGALTDAQLDTLIEKMPSFRRELGNALDGAEMTQSKTNLRNLARRELPEVAAAMDNVAGVMEGTIEESFEGSSEDVLSFMSVLNGAITSSLDFGTNYSDVIASANAKAKLAWVAGGNDVSTFVDVASATLGDYLDVVDQNIADAQAKASNLAMISITMGAEYAEYAAKLPSEVIAQIAEATKTGGAEVDRFRDQVDATSVEAMALLTANIAGATPSVVAEFAALGGGSATELIAAITRGDRSVKQILDDLRNSQANKPVRVPVNAETQGAIREAQAAVDRINRMNATLNIFARTTAAQSAVQGLVNQAGRPINVGEWATGGYTGMGHKNDPAGIVHKGEFVMTKKATEAIGVNNLYNIMGAAQRGYSTGGIVSSSSNSFVQSTGNPVSRANTGGNGGVQIVDFSAQAIQALANALNLQVVIPGAAIAKATSASNINSSARRNA